MKDLFKSIADMGVSMAEFARRTKLSPHTLKRINDGDASVRPSTIGRAKRALIQLKYELELERTQARTKPQTKAATA